MNKCMLVDALHNMEPQSGASNDYARGVLLGVVAGLMANGMTFVEAIALCSTLAPKRVLRNSVPQTWMGQFGLKEGFMYNEIAWMRSEGRN